LTRRRNLRNIPDVEGGKLMSLLTALLAVPALVRQPVEREDVVTALIDAHKEVAELREKLRICEAARDAARADRDQSDAQLRAIYGSLTMQAALQNPPPISYRELAQAQALQAQQNLFLAQNAQSEHQWRPCTCVPGRSGVLVSQNRTLFAEIDDGA
jgi:hypothetical protein